MCVSKHKALKRNGACSKASHPESVCKLRCSTAHLCRTQFGVATSVFSMISFCSLFVFMVMTQVCYLDLGDLSKSLFVPCLSCACLLTLIFISCFGFVCLRVFDETSTGTCVRVRPDSLTVLNLCL